jgi:hypothetical protein
MHLPASGGRAKLEWQCVAIGAQEFAMKMNHSPQHWITVALLLAALLLTLSEAHGQSTGTAASFEGRPAMAGAQAGLGAQAGPPQGGIGVQGSEALSPRDVKRAVDKKEIDPGRDQSLAKGESSVTRKAKRAGKRTITRARHGVSEIDSAGTANVTAPAKL